MDESTEHTNVTFDLEDRTNNNSSGDHNQSFLHHHNKDHWTDVLLASVAGTEDSGHFTASPETTGSGCSGSSRGHSPSPLVIGHGQDFSSQSSSSSTLVLEACRQKSYSMNEDQTVNLSSKIVTSARRSSSETLRLEVTKSGISINNQLACSGEGDECSSSTGHLRAALDNFNSLYKEKLTMIENMGAQGDAFSQQMMMEKKASILECWAKDVCVQNIVLIHTVEELEKQSEEKLKLLQRNIAESSKLAKKHMAVVQSYEDRIKALLNDNKASQEDKNGLQRDLDKVKAEFKRVRGKIGQLEKDNDNLVTLITRIRDMGVWDVAGLELHRRTFTHIFGLYPNLPGSEVQTVFTREKAKSIMETEEKVSKLETEIAELTNHVKCSSEALSSRDSKISQLELEYKQISEKLQTCQLECEHYKKLLIETQEKLLEATKELQVRTKAVSRPNTPSAADSARHAEIQELLHELRIVKAQLNASVNESQSAKEETTIIRREFSERLKQMQESHQCLQSEISHSFEHHHQVQEKEAELAKVKEQAELYKLKYETTEKELNNKDLIICDLQNTIKHLNEKISDIKDEWNRIFSNLDSSAIENDLVDVEESLVKDIASENCTAGLLPLSDEIDNETFSTSGSLVSEDLPIMFGASNGNIIYASKKFDNNVEVLTKEFQEEKLKMKEEFKKEIRDKDIEITMQKLTIQHLQDALVALKRGQPFPVPDSSLNANGINGGGKAKVFDI